MKKVTFYNLLEVINTSIDSGNIDNAQRKIPVFTKQMLDNDLYESGVDSITFIKMIVSIEEKFECEIPDDKLLPNEMNTIRKIKDVLDAIADKDIL